MPAPSTAPEAASTNGSSPRDDWLTVALIGALAYLTAAVAHETIGHGAACLASGGHVSLFTSVHIIGDRTNRFIDLAGPGMGLLTGGILWVWLCAYRGRSAAFRLYLWMAMSCNLFWATGYMLYSGFLAEGDWLALVRGLASPRIGNIALMLVGAAGYGLSVLLSARALPSFVLIDGVRGGRRRLWRLLIIAYLADGITACGAGLFDPQGAGWAIANNSAPASWLAGAGFLALPWLQTGRAIQSTPSAARVERSWRWLLVGALGTGFFVFVLGAGIHC